MSNYTQATDFSAKDALPSGDSNKIIRGSDFDGEFSALATAVNSKADASSPTLTGSGTAVNLTVSGTLNATGTLQIGGVSVTSTAAELNILDGVTATTAELNILDGVTATTAELNILDGVTATTAELNILDGVTATTTELNYVDGVTSSVQTQLDAKAPINDATFTGTTTVPSLTVDDVAFNGTGGRVTLSSTSASVDDKTIFTPSGTDESMTLTVMPSGTADAAFFDAFRNQADLDNSPYARFGMQNTAVVLSSNALGTGSALPIYMGIDGGTSLNIDTAGNVLINGTSSPASAVGSLVLFNGTAPTNNVSNGIILYASGSDSELRVRDEKDNITTLSPHNFSLIPEGPSEDMAWSYYSEKGDKAINIDMLRLARLVEQLSGEKLVYEM